MSNKFLQAGGKFIMKQKATAAVLILLALSLLGCSDPYRIFSQNEEQTVLILPGEKSAAAMAPPAASSVPEESEEGQIVYYVKGSELYHTERSCTFLQKSEAVQSGTLRQAQFAGTKRKCSRCP